MGIKFCTIDEVKAAMQTEDSYSGYDALIVAHIEQSTTLIQQYTRRDWVSAQYVDFASTTDIDTSIRKGNNTFVISMREKPIDVSEANFPKLRYNTGGKWDNSADLETDTYHVDTRKNQIVMYPSVLVSNARAMRITYTAGYPMDATDTDLVLVKASLRAACIAQSVFAVRRAINATIGTNRGQGAERLSDYGMNATGLIREALALVKADVRLMVGSNG